MDRLSALIATISCTLTFATACEDDAATAPPPAAGRVNAVTVDKKSSFADLCDIAPQPAKAFTWPELTDKAPLSSARYRWVNVWATWCKPCVEELPLLTRTFDAWKQQGQNVELTLVSVDADAAAAKAFIAARPGTPVSLQLADAGKASAWLEQIGLASGASIPVHSVLDDKGNLLCARAGGVGATHLEHFKQVMFP